MQPVALHVQLQSLLHNGDGNGGWGMVRRRGKDKSKGFGICRNTSTALRLTRSWL